MINSRKTFFFSDVDCNRANCQHYHNLSLGPSITDCRGLKPTLIKPKNLHLAHCLSNKKDIFNIFYKQKMKKLLQRFLFQEKTYNDKRTHNPIDLTSIYNKRLGSLDLPLNTFLLNHKP